MLATRLDDDDDGDEQDTWETAGEACRTHW